MGRVRRIVAGGLAGVAAGLIVGAGVLSTTGAATRFGVSDRDPAALIEATHLPPLLTVAGESVTLRYEVYCAAPGPDPESGAPCDSAGTVFVRAGDVGPFRPVPLAADARASRGRLAAEIPVEISGAAAGFSYYAVLRSRTTGASTTLPSGGPFAPMRSRPLASPVVVRLGTHVFGETRRPAERVASAEWGGGEGAVGLEPGPELQPIGGSSFDVGTTGVVSVLDEANHRVLRFSPGGRAPTSLPLGIRGTIADLAVAADGGMTVLETVADDGLTPLVRRFDAAGRLLDATHISERSASSIGLGPDGPMVLGYPAGEWMPVTDRGAALPEQAQARRGRIGRVLPNGSELVVEREGDEARIAEVGASGVRRSWRVQSDTQLGEVQLAQPLGEDVVVVVRVSAAARDEFDVLVLGDHRLATRFAVPSTAWAETAPLARFRLRGTSLYELGSTAAGVFVDRYDLGTS